MKRLTCALLASVLVLGLGSTASAISLIDGGTVDFTYTQLPAGPYGGDFHTDGKLLSGVNAAGGTAGMTFQLVGEYWLVVVAGLLDGGSNIDGAALLMRSPVPFLPGVYEVDPVDGRTLFAFVDDAVSFGLPPNPGTIDWAQWLSQILASKKFVSVTGSVTLTTVTPFELSGQFSGLTVETVGGMPVVVSDGKFEVLGTTVAVADVSWGDVKASYRE